LGIGVVAGLVPATSPWYGNSCSIRTCAGHALLLAVGYAFIPGQGTPDIGGRARLHTGGRARLHTGAGHAFISAAGGRHQAGHYTATKKLQGC